ADSESEPVEQRPERHESLAIHDAMVSRSAPLPTPYPPTKLESSIDLSSERSLDSSSLSDGPSRKRCRSPTTLVPEEHMEIGTADEETVADLGISDRVGVDTEDGIGMEVKIIAGDIREDGEEFKTDASARGTMEIVVDLLVTGGVSESTRRDVPDLEGTFYDIVRYMSEVPLDRITELRLLRDSWRLRVAKALSNYEATRVANALAAESQSQNGNDDDNCNAPLRKEDVRS
nr:hypothetical protein [Tanacetum cinerariifolium]